MNTQAKTTRLAIDMTEGPLLGKMIKFTIPIMLTGVLQLLFNATDLVMVGRFAGTAALAGVGCCSSLIHLIVNAFMGLSTGAGVLSSQAIGAKKYDDLQKIINTTFVTSIVAGLLVGAFGFFASEPLLVLMDTPADALSEAVRYMKAYFLGIPACLIYNYLAAVLRASGDTRRPLIFLTVAGVANVGLNYIMVAHIRLGAMGVGIATAVSQFISAALIVIHFLKKQGVCRITGLRPSVKFLGKIVTVGLPAGIQGMMFSISNVLIQSTINGYGTVVMAGNTAAQNIDGFLNVAMNSVHQTALNFTGQNVGAGEYKRVKKIAWLSMLILLCITSVLIPLVLIFGEQLLGIYEPGKHDVIAAGMNRLLVICPTYLLCGAMDVMCGLVRGTGKTIQPMIVALVGTCVFRIVWIYFVCPLAPTNITLLYISYPISWSMTGAAHLVTFAGAYRRLSRGKHKQLI